MKSAEAGATTMASAPRERSMWPMPLPTPVCHRSVSTGRPVSACMVSGVMNRHAAGVITTSTVTSACTNRRASSADLYAAMPPVKPSTMRDIDVVARASFIRALDGMGCAREFTLACTIECEHAAMSTSIAEWPVAERPRERLCARGVGALSDAELVALVLGTGSGARNAVELARDLITHFGTLAAVLSAPCAALARIRGVGVAKAAKLSTVLELARRVLI